MQQRSVLNIVAKGQGIYPVVCGINIINSDLASTLDLALLSYLSSCTLCTALSRPMQGVSHATLAALVQNDTEQTDSLCDARLTLLVGEKLFSVCVWWCEMDMRRLRET